MKIEKSTIVNVVSFRDKKQPDIIVFSANLNMTFEQYLAQSKKPMHSIKGKKVNVPNSISQMLEFDHTLENKYEDRGRSFNIYHYEDDRFMSSFIEIAA